MVTHTNRLDVNFPNLDWIDHGVRVFRKSIYTNFGPGNFQAVTSRKFENWMNFLLYSCLARTNTFPPVPIYAYERDPGIRVGGGRFRDLGQKLAFAFTGVENDKPDSSGLRPDFRFEGPSGVTVIESKVNNTPRLPNFINYQADRKIYLITIGFSDEGDLLSISARQFGIILWEDLLRWVESADEAASARRAMAQVLAAIAPRLRAHARSQGPRMADWATGTLDFTELQTYHKCLRWAREAGIIVS